MTPGWDLAGDAAPLPPAPWVIAMCPDCQWWDVRESPPLSCGSDPGHSRPRLLRAWNRCLDGCHDWCFSEYVPCARPRQHRLEFNNENAVLL